MYEVTEEYYRDTYLGESISTEDFPRLCRRAEEMVEQMTAYNLSPTVYKVLPEAARERVRKAVCAQIEYLEANGGSEVYNSIGMQSASLGKFSYTSGAADGGEGPAYAPLALAFLAPTGLLYRGR